MRILAALLGIFCLVISAYPCCILDGCDSDSIDKIAENENRQQEEECGLCSPFINCGTCTGFVPSIDEAVADYKFQPLALSNLFGLAFKSVEAEYADRVWQPPQQVIVS
ncbi:hypothetical protein LB467_03705 [Salegentibacter sp. JZCK2]|uniref:hypothetical protein n=1 Tax=Salegentibacter tibetensis TaxID=2873600 RepID=UPI001CCFDD68|nr:hypothetical protein [Salegentibacter tibetensis]MBZ9728781.1 hypothetical protein [Salegentibacter tibetensis]